jgi:hypothetical protein
MIRSFVVAAGAVLLCAAPALAGPAGDTLKDALYSGSLAEGRSKLEPLAAGGDTEAAFGVGMLKLAQAAEHFTQILYRHGFDFPDTSALGGTTPLTVPQNPNPEPFDYNGVRQMLNDLVAGLDDARVSFDAASKSGDYVVELNPLKMRLDANGDGKVDEGESFATLFARWSNVSTQDLLAPPVPGGPPKFEAIGFDRADAYWLAGYTEVLAAQADFLLAHDFSTFVNSTFHRFFSRAGFPMQPYAKGNGTLLLGPDADNGIADAIAAVHTISWPVTDAARLAGVRERLKAVLAYSRQDWDAILAETDDDHELLPSPKQTAMIPGSSVTDEKVAAWRATLDEADKILDGTLLVPHWRFTKGFDLRAYFETAKRTDLVMLLTGFDALPYLKDGPIAVAADFQAIQTAFGSDWLGYAFWFN